MSSLLAELALVDHFGSPRVVRAAITWSPASSAGTTRHDACRDAVNVPVTARGGRTPISLASCCGVAPAAGTRGQGKIEVGLDIVRGADVDRAHRDQRLRDQRQPAGMSPAPGAGHGRRRSSASASCRRWASARPRVVL